MFSSTCVSFLLLLAHYSVYCSRVVYFTTSAIVSLPTCCHVAASALFGSLPARRLCYCQRAVQRYCQRVLCHRQRVARLTTNLPVVRYTRVICSLPTRYSSSLQHVDYPTASTLFILSTCLNAGVFVIVSVLFVLLLGLLVRCLS